MRPDYDSLDGVIRQLERTDPEVAACVRAEVRDQNASLKLIASENYCSAAVLCAMATPLNDKYAEGVPGRYKNGLPKRFYSGCDNVDAVEELAARRCSELFATDYAYVQPHSGSDANLLAYWAVLRERVEMAFLRDAGLLAEGQAVPRAADLEQMPLEQWNELRRATGEQRLLAMKLPSGGHLTHGNRQSITSRMFEVHGYGVTAEGLIDYDALADQAREVRPLILLAGYSAYPRRIDFRRMRDIADDVGAVLFVDMAHFAGLVAGKQLTGDENPVPFADIVTFTTHKTLRGPRGGAILASKELRRSVDRGCPMFHGGPMPHVMAAKAVCFGEALQPSFVEYAARTIDNARHLAERLLGRGLQVVSGGTDNHLVLVDLRGRQVTGFQAEEALRACGLTLNRNMVPGDPQVPLVTSGLRLGTPAVTTLGMGRDEMAVIADLVADVIDATRADEDGRSFELDRAVQSAARARVAELTASYAPYPELAGEPS
jgi:glycine hydroxymethyltransferase